MKALDAAVSLRVVRSRVQFVDFQEFADFAEQLRTELRAIINKQTVRDAPSGEDLVHKHFSDCWRGMVPDGERFGPLREVVDDGNHVLIAAGGLGVRSRYIYGDHLPRVSTAERRELSLFWRFSSVVLGALLTSFQLGFNLTFPARPVGSLADLFFSLMSAKMTSSHAGVYNSDELGSVLTWQDDLPANIAGQLSPLSA